MALKATISAAARGPGDLPAHGNRDAVMLVPLPVNEPDPARWLAQIARLTSARKRYPPTSRRPASPGAELTHRPAAGPAGPRWRV